MTRDAEGFDGASRRSFARVWRVPFARARRVPEKMNTEPQSHRDQKRKTDFCRCTLVPAISPTARTRNPFDLLLLWAPWLCGSVFNSSGTRPARAHGTRKAGAHGTRKTSTEAMPQEAC
jgi:hypothetical protein